MQSLIDNPNQQNLETADDNSDKSDIDLDWTFKSRLWRACRKQWKHW